MPAGKIGVDCKTFVQNGGTYDSPTWLEVKRIDDVNVPDEKTAVDSSTRVSATKLYEAGMFEQGADFGMKADANDPAYVLIRNAYYTRGEAGKLLFLISDGAADDAECDAIKGYFIVSKFAKGQPLDGRVTRQVELKPTEKDGKVPVVILGEIEEEEEP